MAATQIPEITLAIQSRLKTGFLRAVQVEYLVMIGNEGPIFGLRARPTKITQGPRRGGVRRDRQPAHAVLERQLTRKVALFECCPKCRGR
jgi:hypothetical protein